MFLSDLSCNQWTKALSFGTIAGYSRAASNTMIVGNALGELMKSIYSSAEKEHVKSFCVGHSLGSHVCGFTGKTKQLDGIIAIDPAGPDFENHHEDNRLDKGDAKFVEALHTDAGWMGIIKPVGHVDIYLNGGRNQPHCFGWRRELGCDHFFPLWYFPAMWERGAKENICRATMKCSNITTDMVSKFQHLRIIEIILKLVSLVLFFNSLDKERNVGRLRL